jgi:hypothetical protein
MRVLIFSAKKEFDTAPLASQTDQNSIFSPDSFTKIFSSLTALTSIKSLKRGSNPFGSTKAFEIISEAFVYQIKIR